MSDNKDWKTPKFSGKKQDYENWAVKFTARAKKKGYKMILDGTKIVPDEKGRTDLEMGKKELSARDKLNVKLWMLNDQAYSDLINGMDDGTSKGLSALEVVKKSKSEKLTDGDARMAWDALKKEFGDTETSDLFELESKYYKA